MIDKIFDKLPYESLGKLKFAHFMLIAVGIGVLVLAGYYFTVYSAGQEEYAGLTTKKQQLDGQLKTYQRLVSQQGAIAKRVSTLVGDMNDAKRQMPTAKELPGLLRNVNRFAGDLGVDLLTFKVMEGSVSDYYKEIPIQIRAKAGFWNTVGFFDALQDQLRVVKVSDLKMESSDTGPRGRRRSRRSAAEERPSQIDTDFLAVTYAFVEGAEDKKTEKPKPKKK